MPKKENRLLTMGKVAIVVGLALCMCGIAINNSPELVSESFWKNGVTDPGSPLINIGGFVLVVGIILTIVEIIKKTDNHSQDTTEERSRNYIPYIPYKFNFGNSGTNDSWLCNCGAHNNSKMKFCGKCGRKRKQDEPTDDFWVCDCGSKNDSYNKFCDECGKKREEQQKENSWICSCGAINDEQNIFCDECGKKKEEPDGSWVCSCGAKCKKKFCPMCGKKKENVPN